MICSTILIMSITATRKIERYYLSLAENVLVKRRLNMEFYKGEYVEFLDDRAGFIETVERNGECYHLKIRLITPESAKNTCTIAGVASMSAAREVFSQVGCEQLREKEITQLELNPDILNGRDFLIINKINEIIKTVNDLNLRVEP